MFKLPPMKVSELTCLLCGSRLELKYHDVMIGDNRGSCPMCRESYLINITKDEMEKFMDAEEHEKIKTS